MKHQNSLWNSPFYCLNDFVLCPRVWNRERQNTVKLVKYIARLTIQYYIKKPLEQSVLLYFTWVGLIDVQILVSIYKP